MQYTQLWIPFKGLPLTQRSSIEMNIEDTLFLLRPSPSFALLVYLGGGRESWTGGGIWTPGVFFEMLVGLYSVQESSGMYNNCFLYLESCNKILLGCTPEWL